MMPARLLGYALVCLGGSLFAFVGGRYAIGALQRQEARRVWDEAQARAIVALARRAVVQGDEGLPIARATPVARLLVPRIGLDEIVLEGVDDDVLNAGPGHLPGSAYPGERGNSVLSAHRDRHFARLGDVLVGDTVVTESGLHTSTWVVISKRIVAADAPALFRTQKARLTLTTCWPIRYLGTAPDRLIVTAELVAPARSPSFADATAE